MLASPFRLLPTSRPIFSFFSVGDKVTLPSGNFVGPNHHLFSKMNISSFLRKQNLSCSSPSKRWHRERSGWPDCPLGTPVINGKRRTCYGITIWHNEKLNPCLFKPLLEIQHVIPARAALSIGGPPQGPFAPVVVDNTVDNLVNHLGW